MITQLSKETEELKQKGVTIVMVEASKIDQSKLCEWVKKNNITFPVGIIQDNPSTTSLRDKLGTGEEKTRFAWDVKALPWLILTDKQHTVIAEGFGINELDDKIKEAEEE